MGRGLTTTLKILFLSALIIGGKVFANEPCLQIFEKVSGETIFAGTESGGAGGEDFDLMLESLGTGEHQNEAIEDILEQLKKQSLLFQENMEKEVKRPSERTIHAIQSVLFSQRFLGEEIRELLNSILESAQSQY